MEGEGGFGGLIKKKLRGFLFLGAISLVRLEVPSSNKESLFLVVREIFWYRHKPSIILIDESFVLLSLGKQSSNSI